jgi:hypothetical protein
LEIQELRVRQELKAKLALLEIPEPMGLLVFRVRLALLVILEFKVRLVLLEIQELRARQAL